MHVVYTSLTQNKRLLVIPVAGTNQAGIASFDSEHFDVDNDGAVVIKTNKFAVKGEADLGDFTNNAGYAKANAVTNQINTKDSANRVWTTNQINTKDSANRTWTTDRIAASDSTNRAWSEEKFIQKATTDLSEFPNESDNKFIRKDDMVNIYEYKGSVSTFGELPKNASNGDIYNVVSAYNSNPPGTNYAWVESKNAWDPLGGDLSQIKPVGFTGSYNSLHSTPPIIPGWVFRNAELVTVFPLNPTIGDVVKRKEVGDAIRHYYWDGGAWTYLSLVTPYWSLSEQLMYSASESMNYLRTTYPLTINDVFRGYASGLMPPVDRSDFWYNTTEPDPDHLTDYQGFGRNVVTVKMNAFYPMEGGFDDGKYGRIEPDLEDVTISEFYHTLCMTHYVWNVLRLLGDEIELTEYGESTSTTVSTEEYLTYWLKHIGLSSEDYEGLISLFIDDIILTDDTGEFGHQFHLERQPLLAEDQTTVLGHRIVVKANNSPKLSIFDFWKNQANNLVQFHEDETLLELDLGALSQLDTVDTDQIKANAVTNAKLAEMATKTLKGNTTTSNASPTDLSACDVRTLLNVADGAQVNVIESAKIAGTAMTISQKEASISKTDLLSAINVADGAQVNVIESIYVNGTKQTPDTNKAVSLSIPYDQVIRTQSDFEALIASPNWLGATSVALVGQFSYSEANNRGIKVPATVKQIHGFNSAKITVTNFKFNSSTAKGGLWYDALPTTLDYSICDLEVDCTEADTGTNAYGFRNCTTLTNCTGTGTGTSGSGFVSCTNLTNCTGTGTGPSDGYGFGNCENLTNCTGTGTGSGSSRGYGFYNCTKLANCTGTGTGTGTYGYGFYNCTNLTNCTGKGTGPSDGYGFYDITRASNCKDGGSKTAMWGGTNKNIGIDDSSAQTITGVKTYTASPIVPITPSGPAAAVAKSYVDGLTPYDKVIRTQAEFNALINSPNWLGATSVALVGQFSYSEANNRGIKVPATVKQIHGFNSAKITVTNFEFNSSTAKGGLWYDTRPTTNEYSICDLEVDCTGTGKGSVGYGFVSCTNLTNCTGTGTGPSDGYGFGNCENLTNCTGTGTGSGSSRGYGFYNCTKLANCTGTGTGTGTYGYGFRYCTNLTNCTGTGTGTGAGYGFYDITYASNCKDGGSSTNMWDGENKNIDIETCCKTPVTANNTTLNT